MDMNMERNEEQTAEESFCHMERSISTHGHLPFPTLSTEELNEAAIEWDRLFISADGIEKWGDCLFFEGGL
jgi:hypothetical protein